MKAIVFDEQHIQPMMVHDWPKPELNEGEVLVRLHAAALNHRDLNLTNPNNKVSFIYGSDGAGVVEQVGLGVSGIQAGEEVILNSMVSCMECDPCRAGNHALCLNSRLLGGITWGGTFAEYVKIPARNVVKKPEHLSMEQAAALPMALGTAWRALITQAQLKKGDTLLIQGVGGGVALAALQIAVAMGVKVIVTTGSEEKLQKALEMGAFAGIQYKKENVVERVKELTNGLGADVIVASTGDAVGDSIHAVRNGGRIVQFAYVGKPMEAFDVDQIMFKQVSLIGSAMHSYDEFLDMIDFINTEKIVPIVSEVYPMEQYKVAFDRMIASTQFGKIVITV